MKEWQSGFRAVKQNAFPVMRDPGFIFLILSVYLAGRPIKHTTKHFAAMTMFWVA
jgi:hypothetical protein